MKVKPVGEGDKMKIESENGQNRIFSDGKNAEKFHFWSRKQVIGTVFA